MTLRHLLVILCCAACCGCDRRTTRNLSATPDPILSAVRLANIEVQIFALLDDEHGGLLKSMDEVIVRVSEGSELQKIAGLPYPVFVLKDLDHWRNAQALSGEVCLLCLGKFATPDRRFPNGVRELDGIAISFGGSEFWVQKTTTDKGPKNNPPARIRLIDPSDLRMEQFVEWKLPDNR
jgi:hypothetical protein